MNAQRDKAHGTLTRPRLLRLLPGTFLVYLCMGSLSECTLLPSLFRKTLPGSSRRALTSPFPTATVEYEMYTQLACRQVDFKDAQARDGRHPAPTFDSSHSRTSRSIHSHPTSFPATSVLKRTILPLPDWINNESGEARAKRCRQSVRVEELATTYRERVVAILPKLGLICS